jgi:hypothetical protein
MAFRGMAGVDQQLTKISGLDLRISATSSSDVGQAAHLLANGSRRAPGKNSSRSNVLKHNKTRGVVAIKTMSYPAVFS